jgi:hypothetical protein
VEPKEYPHVFLNSPTGGFLGFLIGSISFVLAAGAGMQKPPNLSGMATGALLGLAFWAMGIRSFVNTDVALKLGPAGLWTPTLGFLPWRYIQVGLSSVASGKAGSFEFLIIKNRQTQKQLEVIALAGLSGPTAQLSRLLQQYKRG